MKSPRPLNKRLSPSRFAGAGALAKIDIIRDLKFQRRGRQRERQMHVHHAFLYISSPVFAGPRRENAYFRVLWRK